MILSVFYSELGKNKLNPIRSGLFQTVNDPWGGGALKAPTYDLENIVSIFIISNMCILPGVLGMFQLEFF